MKVNIYYGGRGLLDDPTLFVLGKMKAVLAELRVSVELYNLAEQKNNIMTMPQTLKTADAVILGCTVEWYGVGGYMMQFLDACWLYGDKEKISHIYMCPVVMSTTYGEQDGKQSLINAWEILGGKIAEGLCGYVEDPARLDMTEEYTPYIEKKAELLYRTVSQNSIVFPNSNSIINKKVSNSIKYDLTPVEAERLSEIVSDDKYKQIQKEDIQELTSMFEGMMGKKSTNRNDDILNSFKEVYTPMPGIRAIYRIMLEGSGRSLSFRVTATEIVPVEDPSLQPDIELNMPKQVLEDIMSGRSTFQRSFMDGKMTTKGDFKIFRAMDQIFPFS